MRKMNLWIAVVALTAAAFTGVISRGAHAQTGLGDTNGMVGSWRVNVDVTNPAGFPSFPVLMTFHSDGTVVESRLSYIPQGPSGAIVETTGHGAWQRLPGNQIAASFLSLLQGAPGTSLLNGAFWATEKLNMRPVLGSASNTFTAT